VRTPSSEGYEDCTQATGGRHASHCDQSILDWEKREESDDKERNDKERREADHGDPCDVNGLVIVQRLHGCSDRKCAV